ncbi:MAG: hypothetical protein A2X05_02150 [Bacteroidetes bacterium GWE2_41_25]|nr:MAG: hypothetical protein A2X05_02150 [Bacteroidetes bacterium GWE2_41_25]HBH85895.1 hypothetical protein [Bacteroidales bacterium]
MKHFMVLIFAAVFVLSASVQQSTGIRVGTGISILKAENSMQIAGSILPGTTTGQDGDLRVCAIVLEKKPVKVAIVTCDILMISRKYLDPVLVELEKSTGIPAANILVNSSHTHHAPSTVKVHGYDVDEVFAGRVQHGIIDAVTKANASLSKEDYTFNFYLGKEETVGQNSRWLLPNGKINWIHPVAEYVRPTGPFDPELPVLTFTDPSGKMKALLFNHSTHHIGTRNGGYRSPGFYGLAAQSLEKELDCPVLFLNGASGSTHNVTLSGPECTRRIKAAVLDANDRTTVKRVNNVASAKRTFKFKVRQFDEAKEDEAVRTYDRSSEDVVRVFRDMRKNLASQQGQERETWLQAMVIGDVAIVGVPAEYFTQLGIDIKNRSPFRYTYVAELSNDYVGYLPDLTSHKLGGYQVWTGYHSYAEPGTGERIVDEVVDMLKELAQKK